MDASQQEQQQQQQHYAAVATRYKLEQQLRSGANWFYWIAGLSALNTIIYRVGGSMSFFFGLGITQMMDGLAIGLRSNVGEEAGTIIGLVLLGLSIGVVGLFILLGWLARGRRKWPFIVGMALYGLDALLFLIVQDYLSLGFHAFGLIWFFNGLGALNKIKKLDEAAGLAVVV